LLQAYSFTLHSLEDKKERKRDEDEDEDDDEDEEDTSDDEDDGKAEVCCDALRLV
jgi:hypothetical protein